MNRKTIVIIGAGVSGLTAGIYALQNGFHAIILEKNPSVGGLCTGWYRQGRYIDGCIHWLTGTHDGNDLNDIWRNVGAIDNDTNIIYLDSWGTFEYQGTKVTLWKDLDKAEREWTLISPIDRKEIHHFFKMVKRIKNVELPLNTPVSLMNPFRVIKLGLDVMSVWPTYLGTMKMSCEKYAKRFKHPALRWAIEHAQPGDGNLYSMLFSYGTIANDDGGIPEGGSKAMVERMKNRFLSLGGTLKLNTSVSHVIKNKNKCIGVLLNDGTKYYSDYVISAVDANYTVSHLLLKQYPLNKLDIRFYDKKNNPIPSCLVLNFEADNIETPIPYSFECAPFKVGTQMINHLTIRNYNYDPKTYVKDGKTIISVLIDQYCFDYDYWNQLYKENIEEYRKKKEEISYIVSREIIKKFPQFADNLKVLDVFTPKTLNRYTNASRGGYMGFLFTKKKPMFTHNGFVKGLKNFVMAGQWMQCPGGLPLAAASGKFAVQRICKLEKISYAFSAGKLANKKTSH